MLRLIYSATEKINAFFGIKNIAKKKIITKLQQEKNQFIKWPQNSRVAFNIQIDDFSVRSSRNSPNDFGGEKGIYDQFKKFLKQNPKLKFSVFLVPDPLFKKTDRENHTIFSEGSYDLSKEKYSEWVERAKDLNVELALHGLHHVQTDKLFCFPYAEFEFKNKQKSKETITKGLKILSRAGIKSKGFKPPAWGVGHNVGLALPKILQEFNFDYVCLSSPISGLNQFSTKISNFYPEYYNNVLNIPQNINLNWDWQLTKKVLNQLIQAHAVITVQAHFTPRTKKFTDGLDQITFNKIIKIIDYVIKKTDGEVWFAELQEIANYWKKHK